MIISTNLKTRIYTSIFLFILLFLAMINAYIMGYLLILTGLFAFLEFVEINKKILSKKKLKQFLANLLFITYLFCFCSVFLISSFYLHLKTIVFLILIICIFSDIGGFIFGKFFKGKKLTKISPKKTWSGSIGSFILSSIVGLSIVYYLTDKIELKILLTAIIVSFFCQLGDLFFSLLKRKSNLKDTSSYLPGHGGVLDRIDGILLGIPAGLITMLIIS